MLPPTTVFHVDGDVSEAERHRFISLGKSVPVISTGTTEGAVIALDASKQIMDAIIRIMTAPGNFAKEGKSHAYVRRPPMLENLTQLLHDLGEAASAV